MLDQEKAAAGATSDSPALKAEESGPSPMDFAIARRAASMGESMDGAGLGGELGGKIQRKAGDVAASGFTGGGKELPHRAGMEKSFGRDLGHIRAHTGADAKTAAKGLGAHAYAMGNDIAFADSSPDPSLVAHEVTHVLQQEGGGAGGAQMKGASEASIDTSGEAEAERVEAAVKAGKPAHSVLGGGTAREGGPALKAGKGIARAEGEDSKFTMGMSFSPTGLEKSYSYKLWSPKTPIEVPIVAVPGLNFTVRPDVSVKAAGALDWSKSSLSAELGVEGNVLLGLSYGNAAVAEVYGGAEATVTGGFEYEKEPEHWTLNGGIGIGADLKIGVGVAGGLLDWSFVPGKIEVGRLTGLAWKDGKFDKGKVGWEWSEQIKSIFEAIKKAIEKAKELLSRGKDALNATVNAAKATGQAVYQAGSEAIAWVSSW